MGNALEKTVQKGDGGRHTDEKWRRLVTRWAVKMSLLGKMLTAFTFGLLNPPSQTQTCVYAQRAWQVFTLILFHITNNSSILNKIQQGRAHTAYVGLIQSREVEIPSLACSPTHHRPMARTPAGQVTARRTITSGRRWAGRQGRRARPARKVRPVPSAVGLLHGDPDPKTVCGCLGSPSAAQTYPAWLSTRQLEHSPNGAARQRVRKQTPRQPAAVDSVVGPATAHACLPNKPLPPEAPPPPVTLRICPGGA